jgi:hypothetical protein
VLGVVPSRSAMRAGPKPKPLRSCTSTP